MIGIKCKYLILNPVLGRQNNIINCNRSYIHTVGATVKNLIQTDMYRWCKMPLHFKNKTNRFYSSFSKNIFTCKKCSYSSIQSSQSRLIKLPSVPTISFSSCTTWNQFNYRRCHLYFSLFSRNRSCNFFRSSNRYFYNNVKLNSKGNSGQGKVIYSVKNSIKLETNRGGEMKRLFELAKREKWKLTGAIFLLLISSCITMAIPFSLGKVIDLIYTTDAVQMKDNLNKLSILLFAIFLLGGVCNFGRVYLMNICGHRITKDLRQKVFLSVIRQEVAFFDKNKTGELVNRLSADTALVGQCVTMNISDGLRSTVMACAGVSMMFYVSPQLACIGLAIVPPVAIVAIVYGRFVRKITKRVQDALAEATQVAEERISNVRTVKAFSREKQEIDMYNDRMENVYALAAKESLARGLFFGLTGFSGNVIILTVLYSGVSMVGQGGFTVGSLSAFLFYAAYVGISLSGLSSFYAEMNKGLGASTRLFQIIDRVPTISMEGGLRPSNPLNGDVAFQNVVFAYPSRPDSTILNKLNLSIKSGSVTAVVGHSGSGKSTLASLIIRLYDPQSGTVTIDGLPVSMYDPVWLRSYIGTVSQEPVLFSGTIRDNIVYGAENPSQVKMDAIEMAAKEANAYDFITKDFPQGFDTRVGERGIMLSGGQKQRVAIARALIKNPRILLLDEATSALDAESEHLVQEALERIMKGRTVLTIAHRLSTIKNADQIAVLKDGTVVQLGTYDQLMSDENGAFRKLVQHQAFHSLNHMMSPLMSPTLDPTGMPQEYPDNKLKL